MKYKKKDVINFNAPQIFVKENIVCTDPFPKVVFPNTITILWSFKEPVSISASEVEPKLTKTIIGIPFKISKQIALFSIYIFKLFPFV